MSFRGGKLLEVAENLAKKMCVAPYVWVTLERSQEGFGLREACQNLSKARGRKVQKAISPKEGLGSRGVNEGIGMRVKFEDLDNVAGSSRCRRRIVAVDHNDDPPPERGEILNKFFVDVREVASSEEKTGYAGINFEVRDDKNETGERRNRGQCRNPPRVTPREQDGSHEHPAGPPSRFFRCVRRGHCVTSNQSVPARVRLKH